MSRDRLPDWHDFFFLEGSPYYEHCIELEGFHEYKLLPTPSQPSSHCSFLKIVNSSVLIIAHSLWQYHHTYTYAFIYNIMTTQLSNPIDCTHYSDPVQSHNTYIKQYIEAVARLDSTHQTYLCVYE